MTSVTLPAYAKLNLTLDILRKREDGYHDLRMVMQSVELHDDVSVTMTQSGEIVCHCGDIPGDESNLAVKAARAFFARTDIVCGGLAIDVEKRIPAQAGMAGGSSDAAATLRALRKLLRPDMLGEELERIGATVGSDVPYCLRGGTALAEGRGERLTTLRAAPPFYVLLCKPDFDIPTPKLFARVRVSELWNRPDTPGMLEAIHRGDADGVVARVKNAFESVLPQEYAGVFEIKRRMRELGAETSAMTGSGPTVFGLFRDYALVRDAYAILAEEYERTFLTQFV